MESDRKAGFATAGAERPVAPMDTRSNALTTFSLRTQSEIEIMPYLCGEGRTGESVGCDRSSDFGVRSMRDSDTVQEEHRCKAAAGEDEDEQEHCTENAENTQRRPPVTDDKTHVSRSTAMRGSTSSADSTHTARAQDSTYGVRSLAETLEEAFGQDGESTAFAATATETRSSSPQRPTHRTRKSSSDASETSLARRTMIHRRKRSRGSLSPSPSNANLDMLSPFPASSMQSPSRSVSVTSLRSSDGVPEDTMSQAVVSDGDEDDAGDEQIGAAESLMSFPQLVMPSIQMPERRPFTAKGRAMGRLKVLIAGPEGVGKTSLIRSIVQICEDIVHVDPLSPSQSLAAPSPQPPLKSKSRKQRAESSNTTRITEINASTKAYPHWWTEIEEGRKLRRKSSTSDSVLERNITFVDTPGYGEPASAREDQNLVVEYVESLFYQNATVTSMEDSELVGIIGGNGGVQVDVVFYLLHPAHDISNDVDFMQRLSALTNVIPIIAKSDTLTPSEIVSVKTSILARLQTTCIKPFFFGKPVEDALLAVQGLPIIAASSRTDPTATVEGSQYPFNFPTYPYAISTNPGQDLESMDASLLMSPDYVQLLLPSELATLVNQVFDPESIAWLRHIAAKKFVAWRRRNRLLGDSSILRSVQQESLRRSRSPGGCSTAASQASASVSASAISGVLVPRTSSSFYLSTQGGHTTTYPHSPFPTDLESSLSQSPSEWNLTRYNTATQQQQLQNDQRLAEVRLAKWAADLQRSLRNEREVFEELQRAERGKWLLERLHEEGAVAPADLERRYRGAITYSTPGGGPPRAEWALSRQERERRAQLQSELAQLQLHPYNPLLSSQEKESAIGKAGHWGYGAGAGQLDSRDPLGLCELGDEVRRRGVQLVKMLGGVSVVGALVLAVCRVTGWGWGGEAGDGGDGGGAWGWFVGGAE